MGWDITHHPVGAEEIRSIYFNGLTDQDHYKSLISQFGIDDFYAEQLRIRFEEARNIERDTPFNKGNAFYVAIISGFLRKHHYLRGAAFSFLANDEVMSRYTGDWEALAPEKYRAQTFDNCMTENYCGGVFLPNETKQKVPTWLVLGEVVGVHIASHLPKDGMYDTANAGHILRGGGPADYFTIGPEQLFKMWRPQS